MRTRFLAGLLAGALCAAAAVAQDAPGATPPARAATDPADPDDAGEPTAATASSSTPAGYAEITVTGTRLGLPFAESPGATTVVGADTLRTLPKALSPGEALAPVPGVKVDTQYGSKKAHLSIRGQGILTERGVRGIQVLLDGIPLNDPTGFAPDLYDVDWDAVQQVEVVRGPSGALYGGGSSAGVISIATGDGRALPDAGGAVAAVGSNGFWKAFGEAGGGGERADWRVSASRTAGDGSRDHSKFQGTNLYGKARLRVAPAFTLDGVVMGTTYFNENPEGLNLAQFEDDPYQANPDAARYNEFAETRRVTLGAVGKARLGARQSLDVTLYGRRTDFTESVPDTERHRTIDNPGALLQYTLRLGEGAVRHQLAAGVDAGRQTIDEYRLPHLPGSPQVGPDRVADQTFDQHGTGVYAMDRVTFGAHWAATVNVRHDDVRQDLDDHLKAEPPGDLSGARDVDETTARVGVTWNPRADLGVFASWGQGFLPPSTEEMLNNPASPGGFNTTIVPATSVGEELGVRGTLGRTLSYEATAFHLDTEDDFERYRIPDRPLETFYGNAGDTHRYGLEVGAGWFPADAFALRLAYTYSHFTYTSIESRVFPAAEAGNELPNSPEHQGFVDVEVRPWPHWFVGASVEALSRAWVDPTNVPYVPGYALWHARAGYRWEGRATAGEVALAVRNATDEVYVAFSEPDPDGNSYQAGPGREVFASARLRLGRR